MTILSQSSASPAVTVCLRSPQNVVDGRVDEAQNGVDGVDAVVVEVAAAELLQLLPVVAAEEGLRAQAQPEDLAEDLRVDRLADEAQVLRGARRLVDGEDPAGGLRRLRHAVELFDVHRGGLFDHYVAAGFERLDSVRGVVGRARADDSELREVGLQGLIERVERGAAAKLLGLLAALGERVDDGRDLVGRVGRDLLHVKIPADAPEAHYESRYWFGFRHLFLLQTRVP